jgi:mannose-6-phosphate isomerase-like protein (cupin superfamily)
MRPTRLTVAELTGKLPTPEGHRWIAAWSLGDLELYAPRGADPQRPHTRDELYVVVQGRGRFRRGEELVDFGPGDLLFAAAGEAHRFEEFDQDLVVWVVFFGPEGGHGRGTTA